MLVRELDESKLRKQYPHSARILRDFGYGYQPGEIVPFARVTQDNSAAEFLAIASPGVYHKVGCSLDTDVEIIEAVPDTVPSESKVPQCCVDAAPASCDRHPGTKPRVIESGNQMNVKRRPVSS